MYIKSIQIKIDANYPGTEVLNKSFLIQPDNINLLVGDQGCGKSTLLKMLSQAHKDLKVELTDLGKQGVNSFYFDTEKDNPRLKDIQMYSTPDGRDTGIGTKAALLTRWQSHGETISDFIFNPLNNAKDCIILLDEPESGLSLTNQYKLIESIKLAASKNCQIFIATHCLPLIEEFDVISLEHNEQMSGKKFIELVKN